MECDFKIGIGGVYPNESAGFGGGAKIVHPGICGKETAQYLHHRIKGVPRGSTRDSEFRADMEEIAEKTGLDFTINVLLNRDRDIGRIFSGHRVTAHQKAAEAAKNFYVVWPSEGADIVIANTYPFDTSSGPLLTLRKIVQRSLSLPARRAWDIMRYHWRLCRAGQAFFRE